MPRPQDLDRVRHLAQTLGPGEALGLEGWSVRLGEPRLDGKRLRALLRELVRRGELLRVRGRGWATPLPPAEVEGVVRRNPRGFGRLHTAAGQYPIPSQEMGHLADGDRARGRLELDARGQVVARRLRGLDQSPRSLVGVLRRIGSSAVVEADDGSFGDPVVVSQPGQAPGGHLVRVEVERGPDHALWRGRLVEVLGPPGELRTEVRRCLLRQGIELEHGGDAQTQAEVAESALTPAELTRRVDLRSRPLVTVDGADARDFDDAVAVEPDGRGACLTVAIADVAHHVPPQSPLDLEARARGNSVYWPGGVAHMLPAALAADVCSLVPHQPRRCVAVELRYDEQGRLYDASLFEAVMQSHARLTYEQVNAALAGDRAARHALGQALPWVEGMVRLSELLQRRARQRGQLDLAVPEPLFRLDPEGEPQDCLPRAFGPAERLIEQFMVAANQAVARWCRVRGLPAVYRVHQEPDGDRLADFAAAAGALTGARLRQDAGPQALAAAVRDAPSPELRGVLSTLLLRSLPQACYEAEPRGHYGLQLEDYLHFTSPIRRYADLWVHRVLKADLHGHALPAELRAEAADVAKEVSRRERVALEVERHIDGVLAARLAQRMPAARLEAAVVGVSRRGLYVRVARPMLEGLAAFPDVEPRDFYVASDDGLRVRGRRSGVRYSLGDRVVVRLLGADPIRREIDFALLGAAV